MQLQSVPVDDDETATPRRRHLHILPLNRRRWSPCRKSTSTDPPLNCGTDQLSSHSKLFFTKTAGSHGMHALGATLIYLGTC